MRGSGTREGERQDNEGFTDQRGRDRTMRGSRTREGERQDNEGFTDQRGRETGQ